MNPLSIIILLFVFGLSVLSPKHSVADSNDPLCAQDDLWAPYNAKPGHPTADEKRIFIDKVSQIASEMEKEHGVPAAALAAMSIIESGYGFTRIALNANNFFGWKFNRNAGEEGVDYYTLKCQPAYDIGNRYVKFQSIEAAFDHIAKRLNVSPYYKTDTEAYMLSKSQGVDNTFAVNTWVSGISNPYNWKPEKYAKDLIRVMNDPFNPGDQLNSTTTLYSLSESRDNNSLTSSFQDTYMRVRDTLSFDTAVAELGNIRPGQYVAGSCKNSNIPDHNYDEFTVLRCTYKQQPLSGVVYVLNPTAKQVAVWIASACLTNNLAEEADCARRLTSHMRRSNSFIFPIAGDVIEPAGSLGRSCANKHGNGDVLVHTYFRDGVTIETERDFTCESYQISEEEADTEAFKKPKKVMNVGRVAAIHRELYAKLMEVSTPTDDQWRTIVRDSYLDAIRTGNYTLLNLVARHLFARN